MPDTAFGRQLRKLRKEASLSQEELAGRAGISVQAIGALERGDRRQPYPRTLRALMEALHASEADRLALLAAAAMPLPSTGEGEAHAHVGVPTPVAQLPADAADFT